MVAAWFVCIALLFHILYTPVRCVSMVVIAVARVLVGIRRIAVITCNRQPAAVVKIITVVGNRKLSCPDPTATAIIKILSTRNIIVNTCVGEVVKVNISFNRYPCGPAANVYIYRNLCNRCGRKEQ